MSGPGRLQVAGASLGVGVVPTQPLQVNGNVRIDNGSLMGLCTVSTYGYGTTPCPAGYYVMGSYGGGSPCTSGGLLFLGGVVNNPARWVPHYEMNCTGNMLCCRIVVS